MDAPQNQQPAAPQPPAQIPGAVPLPVPAEKKWWEFWKTAPKTTGGRNKKSKKANKSKRRKTASKKK